MNHTKISERSSFTHNIVKVKIEQGKSQQKKFYFTDSFTIGRSDECSVQIDEGGVSRVHLEVIKKNDSWWISDKHSSNGSFINGVKIDNIELKDTCSIVLGNNGPILIFSFEESEEGINNSPGGSSTNIISSETSENNSASSHSQDPSLTKYINHYFNESNNEEIGEHTRLVREAFKVVKKKHISKYRKAIIGFAIIAIAAASFSIYLQIRENKQKQLAENIFYNMKSLELEISALKDKLANSNDPTIIKALREFDERYKQLENDYKNVVNDLGVYNLNEEDKIIIQTARVFGECELTMPKEFIIEVKNYINKWKSSDRLIKALKRSKQNGFNQIIVNYLIRNNLPPQFFYLALQESDFKEQIVGPQTKYGYAKGIWQFISETAKRYGLKTGPLANQALYDAADERYNLPKATSAAARYIKDIYDTDAQASGLLVIASYNWGEHNIINLIRKMPENPRDRNFWKLLEKYKKEIPSETYNYVFYIFSAAVIGEDPKLFGFDFDNPLKNALQNLRN